MCGFFCKLNEDNDDVFRLFETVGQTLLLGIGKDNSFVKLRTALVDVCFV